MAIPVRPKGDDPNWVRFVTLLDPKIDEHKHASAKKKKEICASIEKEMATNGLYFFKPEWYPRDVERS